MSKSAQQAAELRLFDDPQQTTWMTPKNRNMCRRNRRPARADCWWWWEGCPKAEKKNCYIRWRQQQNGQNL